MNEETLNLAPPGAGMPFWPTVLTRFILFPLYCRKTTWDAAQIFFEKEGEKILSKVESLDEQKQTTRALIKPMYGIEDSSRFWSPVMVLEHLVIVGTLMARGIVDLSQGRVPEGKADTATVKPLGKEPPQKTIQAFRNFLQEYKRQMSESVVDRNSKIKFRHPWFGRLTAHQWHCLAALHQNIHRRQLAEILKG